MIIRSMTVGVFLLLCACNTDAMDYDREHFGPTWYDTDHNGCDTRNDILRRDLDKVELGSDKCTVISGTLVDPYDGNKVVFAPNSIHIDHVVPLKDAWISGASSWPMQRRIEFANDPDNLVATSRKNNQSKSDKIPGEWMPATDECKYVEQYIAVKAKYDLRFINEIPRCE